MARVQTCFIAVSEDANSFTISLLQKSVCSPWGYCNISISLIYLGLPIVLLYTVPGDIYTCLKTFQKLSGWNLAPKLSTQRYFMFCLRKKIVTGLSPALWHIHAVCWNQLLRLCCKMRFSKTQHVVKYAVYWQEELILCSARASEWINLKSHTYWLLVWESCMLHCLGTEAYGFVS